MRIGIDISQIVYPGGVGVYTRNLVSNLLKIDQENEYILFGTSLRKKAVLEDFFDKLKGKYPNLNNKFYFLPVSFSSLLFNQLRFPKIEFFTDKLDLFHTSDWIEPKTNCPKITTVHDLAPIIYPKLHDPRIVNVFNNKLKLVKKESVKIIAVSQNTKKDLIGRMNLNQKKIVVIYEAVNEEFIRAQAQKEIITKYKLNDYILSDAIKNPRKNLKNLLLAFEKIKDETLKLVLVGEPMWQKQEQYSLVFNSKKKKEIVLTGKVSLGELKALYQNAKAAVFPSFYEGFGLPILEAMFYGSPVITSNLSSMAEIAGKAALLINPYEILEIAKAIKDILTRPLICQQLKELGYQRVKQFSWKKAAEQTLMLYNSLITNC